MTRVALAIVLAPFAPVAGLLAVGGLVSAVLFFKDPFAYVDALRGAPTLPSWAYPEGKLTETGPCGGNSYQPHCRHLTFGSNATIPDLIAELRAEFEERGWSVTVGATQELLSVDSPSRDVCMYYLATSGEEARENARNYVRGANPTEFASGFWGEFSTRVEVEVSDCSDG